MTFGFGLVLVGTLLLDAGWKGTTPIEVLRGATSGTHGAGGVLAETGREVKEGVTRTPANGGTEAPLTKKQERELNRQLKNHKGYVNPFGAGATSGRIDQGKDVGGSGPIKAIGNGRVLKTGAPGWPGGERGILYELTDGPLRGKVIYIYEGVQVLVREGERVAAGQVIGHIIPGTETGIETGFADRNGVPLSHAEYTEGKETVWGKKFTQFLASLGFK